jgi:hypothetical protein
MSIRCACPNGHPLTVSESLAGKTGLCPLCRAPVRVPQKQTEGVTEEAILDMLRPQVPSSKVPALSAADLDKTAFHSDLHEHTTPKKSCFRCNHEISYGSHICPYCHTYIASLQDF